MVTSKEMMQEMTIGLHVRNVVDQVILSVIDGGIEAIIEGNKKIRLLQA